MALESRKQNKPTAAPVATPASPATTANKAVAAKPVIAKTIAPVKPLEPLFGKQNYLLMAVGGLVIALGMFLMAGGKNAPDQFDYKLVYGTTRITIAPLLILLGFAIEIVAIFRRSPAPSHQEVVV